MGPQLHTLTHQHKTATIGTERPHFPKTGTSPNTRKKYNYLFKQKQGGRSG